MAPQGAVLWQSRGHSCRKSWSGLQGTQIGQQPQQGWGTPRRGRLLEDDLPSLGHGFGEKLGGVQDSGMCGAAILKRSPS